MPIKWRKRNNTCGTCGRWEEGRILIVGNCSAEMEGTTRDHKCEINLWIPKEETKNKNSGCKK